MKEKTKQILRYVACGLGGLALGIGLLGGLSMCATSSNKTTESVNTILTKTPKGEQITTANGGFTGYKMSFSASGRDSANNKAVTHVYQIDTSNWSPSPLQLSGMRYDQAYQKYCWYDDNVYNWQTFVNVVNQRYNDAKSNTPNNVRLMHTWCAVNWWNSGTYSYLEYWSFVAPAQALRGFSFIYMTPSWTTYEGLKLDSYETAFGTNQTQRVILTYAKTGYFLIDTTRTKQPTGEYYFQDIESYYKDQGYQSGYSGGYSEGYEDGDQEGYDNGYQDGNEHGQAQGYEDGYDGGLTDGLKYGQEFTTYQIMTQSNNGGTYWPSYGWDINNNAPAGMYGDFSSSTYQIANLLQYKTEDNDLHLIYLMLPIADNDYFGHCYIYVYNQTDSTLEDTVANGLMYYQAAADHYGWDYAHIYWTSGGTRTINYGKVTGIYNDSLRKGYIQLTGQITDQNVYDTGYQAGLLAGQQNSNMNNVFSLFTGAFDACASFFNLRIFGFLPLYWFFLAPLFIALITLLLRMVKH